MSITHQKKGYFAVGVAHTKTEHNIGTLLRSAHAFDAALVFTIGRRYQRQASDTSHLAKHVPLIHLPTIDALVETLPWGCQLIGVEIDSRSIPLRRFVHPERACYLLGSEDNGIPSRYLERCHQIVQLPGRHCLNVAVAGSLVLAHRLMSRDEDTLERAI